MKFADLNLDPSLQASIDRLGFAECTPIQTQSIPHIVEGKDIAGLAQTGTGKTAAFLIPLMERILRARPRPPDLTEEQTALWDRRAFKDWRPQNFVLVLVPTRELAEQVMENIEKLGVDSGLRGVSIYGGTSYEKQKEGLRNGVEFVAATPGRLIDLYKEHLVDLKQVRAVVFDEADRMFDMGFKDDMKYILQRIPSDRQYLVFSATLNFDVLNTAYQFGSEPIEINISRDQTKAENVKDQIFHCGQDEKPQFLLSLLKKHNPKQAIVFTNFKMNVDRVARFLTDNGIPGMGISSLLSQAQRNRVMESFKAENDKNILVATDVAARGLDIKGVDMVINFELPMDSESYVHRIGRTGRAGHTGTAFSLVSDRDVDSLMRIEEYLKNKLEVGFLEDADIVSDFKPMRYDDGSPGRRLSEGRGGDRDRGPRGGGRDRGPSRGGDRGPRGERGGGRGGDRDRDRRPRGPERRDGAPPREGSSSRPPRGPRSDRPERQQSGAPHASASGGGNGQHRRSGQDSRRRHQGPRRDRPASAGSGKGHRPPPSKASAGLGQKVKGFFKKLFGQS